MAWIVGRKTGQVFIDAFGSDHWTLAKLQESIPSSKGGVVGDYSFCNISANEFEKIFDRWDYTVEWTAGEITGVNFANETAKPWVKLSSDKSFIANDGIDSAIITLEVWKPNLSEIQTNVQRTAFRVPIITPDGDRFVRINITNGVGIATFKTTKSGRYLFPNNPKRYGTMRIFNQLEIHVDELTLLTQ